MSAFLASDTLEDILHSVLDHRYKQATDAREYGVRFDNNIDYAEDNTYWLNVASEDGEPLRFPPGVCWLSNRINMYDGLHAVGAGKGRTIFRAVPGLHSVDQGLFHSDAGASDVYLAGFTIDYGFDPTQYTHAAALAQGLRWASGRSDNITLDTIEIKNVPRQCIAGWGDHENVNVFNCTFKNAGRNGVGFIRGKGFRFLNNYIINTGDDGIHCNSDTLDVLVVGNTIINAGSIAEGTEAPGGFGVTIEASEGVTIVGNTIRNCNRGAIRVFRNDLWPQRMIPNNITITGNTLAGISSNDTNEALIRLTDINTATITANALDAHNGEGKPIDVLIIGPSNEQPRSIVFSNPIHRARRLVRCNDSPKWLHIHNTSVNSMPDNASLVLYRGNNRGNEKLKINDVYVENGCNNIVDLAHSDGDMKRITARGVDINNSPAFNAALRPPEGGAVERVDLEDIVINNQDWEPNES